MSDHHYHHASEIQGAADDRHGHSDLEQDISSVESDLRNHRHYDLEREGQSVAGFVTTLRREMVNLRRELDHALGDLRELRGELAAAQGRIRQLEQQTPEARQAEYEADVALADAAASQADDDRCPDCGRASCTGEDCYWPDGAGIARPEPADRNLGVDARLAAGLIPAAAAQGCTYCGAQPGVSCTAWESAGYHVAR